ncbi:hypothetical protein JCM6882_002769 [Rhodosporidiobolus microsporus]
MAPPSPRISLAKRLIGRKPPPVIEDDESKFDEKEMEIDYLPEVDDGLQTDEAYAFMAAHTFRTCVRKRWVKEQPQAEYVDAVALRRSKRNYILHPAEDPRVLEFSNALDLLNVEIAVTVSADVVSVIVGSIPADSDVFSVTEHDHIQVVESMPELAYARAAQHACFIRDEKRLVVWADKVDELESTVQELEAKLVHYVFNRTLRRSPHNRSSTMSTFSSFSSTPRLSQSPSMGSLAGMVPPVPPIPAAFVTPNLDKVNEKVQESADAAAEAAAAPAAGPEVERRLPLNHAIYTGLGVSLDLVLCGLIIRTLLIEALWDKQYINLAILAVLPFFFCICLFFSDNVVSVILQFLAPVGVLGTNSLYFSAKPPVRNITGPLPHVTIMMPVYKESLEEVLAPTIESVSQAIRTYELQGGTASIIVCEDGMQLVDAEDVERRKEYYDKWHCAFVARPKENRAGRFKKSSNLNVTMALSLRIEELMDERRPTDLDDLAAWTSADEDRLYDSALATALDEKENILWANGNIRIGEYILLIDSDTRVPRDCLLDGACEMNASPEVGILQHASGTFLAGAGYFENYISFFTTCVNHAISWCTANGATAPFVGHNAFLRWSALQHQALSNPEGKVWSEEHVSEDFVMTLCLNRAGYITRWATYSKGEYQEGVSLSCDDEINRWQKYAFGCSEIVFTPFKDWWKKGPLSSLFLRYLWGNTPLPTKVSSAAYIASYWAIAVAPPMTLAYYLLSGWLAFELSAAFTPSFGTLISVIVVFAGGGTAATISSRYRSQAVPLRQALVEGITNIPYGFLFFSGLPLSVMTALCAHITSYNMTWGATQKDLETPSIQEELPAVLKRRWLNFLLSGLTIAGVAVLATDFIPLQWRISSFTIMFPLLWLACGHFLYPLLLNPAITLFKF